MAGLAAVEDVGSFSILLQEIPQPPSGGFGDQQLCAPHVRRQRVAAKEREVAGQHPGCVLRDRVLPDRMDTFLGLARVQQPLPVPIHTSVSEDVAAAKGLGVEAALGHTDPFQVHLILVLRIQQEVSRGGTDPTRRGMQIHGVLQPGAKVREGQLLSFGPLLHDHADIFPYPRAQPGWLRTRVGGGGLALCLRWRDAAVEIGLRPPVEVEGPVAPVGGDLHVVVPAAEYKGGQLEALSVATRQPPIPGLLRGVAELQALLVKSGPEVGELGPALCHVEANEAQHGRMTGRVGRGGRVLDGKRDFVLVVGHSAPRLEVQQTDLRMRLQDGVLPGTRISRVHLILCLQPP